VWAVSRRTGLFIVSYVPLATMFAVLKWPAGWTAVDLIRLACTLIALAGLLLLVPALVSVTGSVGRWTVRAALLIAVGVALLGILNGWLSPMALHVPTHKTSAAVAALAFAFAALGLMIVGLLLYNARRAGAVRWTVSDSTEQGSAVAGYLATYLLPLLAIQSGGWRVTAAYGVYLVVLYVVYVQSDSLVLINPTLYLFGYRIYGADVVVSSDPPTRRRVLLLTKLRITGDAEVNILPLGGDNHLAFSTDDHELETP
jgi:hypothetical protein